MKVTPVSTYTKPDIPTILYVDEHPEILSHIPRRWIRDAMIMTTLAGTVMLLSSCGGGSHKVSVPGHGGGSNIVPEPETEPLPPGPPPMSSLSSETNVRLLMRNEASKYDISLNDLNSVQNTSVFAQINDQTSTESKQLLRSQVKDFIKWLKSEGVV